MQIGKVVAILAAVLAINSPFGATFAETPSAVNSSSAFLSQDISKQLKPHWNPPKGQDSEILVTVLSWDLNPDGSLIGRPQIVYQSGVTSENRVIASHHAMAAIRAVKEASPFNLPPEQYAKWRRIVAWRFDTHMSYR